MLRAFFWPTAIFFGILLPMIIFLLTLIPTGSRRVSDLENTQGVPFERIEGKTYVTEQLAHADIALAQPSLASTLELDLTFIPREIVTLAVGVRENSFWLSYPLEMVYTRDELSADSPHTVSVRIPLTDKLQDYDRSVDLMFVADTTDLVGAATQPRDVGWELVGLDARIKHSWPQTSELRDFARSALRRERPL